MKTKFLLVICLLATLGFSACDQQDAVTCDYYFYTSEDPNTEQWTLYIDGQNVGPLVHPAVAPSCALPTESLSTLLHLTLDSRKHTFQAKDANGVIRSVGYVKSNDSKTAAGAGDGKNGGGITMQGDCGCFLVDIFD